MKLTYHLPAEKIAVFPVAQRDQSKLLVFQNNAVRDEVFANIDRFIPDNSILVRNNTKVIKSRIFLNDEAGRRTELFCLNKLEEGVGFARYECMLRNIKKYRTGNVFASSGNQGQTAQQVKLRAEYLDRVESNALIRFSWEPTEFSAENILDIFGVPPLPPYIKREAVRQDEETYQTVYAAKDGSVAAPTAGLHFTENVFRKLRAKNIEFLDVLLHIGLGTFKPIQSNNLREHAMHSEQFSVSRETIQRLALNKNNPLITVGTTSLRTLESIYLLGHFLPEHQQSSYRIEQFQYEDIKTFLQPSESFAGIEAFMLRHSLDELNGETSLMITPEYVCKTADYIVTNFHQPESTLLLIIASFLGERWKELYTHALSKDYRFLSYGDACFFENTRKKELHF